MLETIDWGLVAVALDFYERRGFQRVEVPWFASQEVNEALMPREKRPYRPFMLSDSGMEMIGSGEASLVQMLIEGQLEVGRGYVTATPCFRYESPYTPLSAPQFFKVELVRTGPVDATQRLLAAAKAFYASMEVYPEEVQTDEGIDLTLNGIEIGSYGYRHVENMLGWTYGTGLALPRFSTALESNGGEE